MKRTHWAHGEKAELSRRSGISRHTLSDILAGRKNASPTLAALIHAEAEAMGLGLSRLDILYPVESTNPLLGRRNDS